MRPDWLSTVVPPVPKEASSEPFASSRMASTLRPLPSFWLYDPATTILPSPCTATARPSAPPNVAGAPPTAVNLPPVPNEESSEPSAFRRVTPSASV